MSKVFWILSILTLFLSNPLKAEVDYDLYLYRDIPIYVRVFGKLSNKGTQDIEITKVSCPEISKDISFLKHIDDEVGDTYEKVDKLSIKAKETLILKEGDQAFLINMMTSPPKSLDRSKAYILEMTVLEGGKERVDKIELKFK
ncbi:MAG: copper chaperone PCu(A)C [Deltaproteobacteria bacterium]|nr:copper chaperone PCu(A)C [Deltaproteobacteria bacterium]